MMEMSQNKKALIAAGLAAVLAVLGVWLAQRERATEQPAAGQPDLSEPMSREARKAFLKQLPPSGEVLTEEEREQRKQIVKERQPGSRAPVLSEEEREQRKSMLKSQ